MTTTPKSGAQKADAAHNDMLERDNQEPTVQLMITGARDTHPIEAVPTDAGDQPVAGEDEAATVLRQSVRPEAPSSSRPRKNTLAMAITRPTRQEEQAADSTPPSGFANQGVAASPPDAGAPSHPVVPAASPMPAPPIAPPAPAAEMNARASDEVEDEIEDEVDEWAVADQPTVYLSPRTRPSSRPNPTFLETGEGTAWPPRPARAEPRSTPPRGSTPVQPIQRPSPALRPAPRQEPLAPPRAGSPRLVAPDGRVMPGTPPAGVPRAALPNPRMQRFQELHGRLEGSEGHELLHQEPRPVAEVVRRWWHDLLPGLEGALHYQREAKASGVHPIPAYAPEATSRLGDAFGRVAASARDLTERAQAAAAPTLKRLHAQAEQAAQAIVDKIEGSPARQQFPLLGPGRIAVFFKQGVTVGQAQKLLAASQARPIRLIPRKHGFLTLVPPGTEAEVAERLRVHPYVRDVAFLEYDEYGQPVRPER